jgi:hypothetical protein
MSGKTMTWWMTAGLGAVLLLMPASLPHSRQAANILTPVCQAPDGEIASEAPLRHLPAVLQTHARPRVLAIGSSSTAGVGSTSPYNTYPAQLEAILERLLKDVDLEMFNRGVSGEIATTTAERLRQEVERLRPHLVLWQVGTNDALSYIPVDELRATLLDTIAWLKRHNVDVVLAGLQFVNRMQQDDHYKAVRELIRKVAADEKVMVVRRTEAMRLLTNAAGSGGGLFPEEFAQTEVGYSCLAEYVTQAITLGAFGKGLKDQPPRPAPAPAPGQPTSPAPSR